MDMRTSLINKISKKVADISLNPSLPDKRIYV
jgi:hypothetical protein